MQTENKNDILQPLGEICTLFSNYFGQVNSTFKNLKQHMNMLLVIIKLVHGCKRGFELTTI